MKNPYLKNYLISFQDNINYRIDFFIRLITGFLASYATVAIWDVIIGSNKASLDSFTLFNTIKYMILATAFMQIFTSVPGSEITNRVRSGEIGRDLIYPISLPISLFFKSLGGTTAVVLTRVVPSIIGLSIIFNTNWEFKLINIAGLLIGGILGYYIYFLINMQIDMICFWWYETFYFHYIKEAVFMFLSGSLVPLWFYPEWLYKIINWLPFKNIIYVPLGFYLGKTTPAEFAYQLLICLVWIGILNLLTVLIWRAGTKKVVVQGG